MISNFDLAKSKYAMAEQTERWSLSLGKVIVIAIIFLILGIWIGAWWWAYSSPEFFRKLTSQPLADIFSSVNALFAGFACAGVLVTIYIQISEVAKTAASAEATARALTNTADANEKTARASLQIARHSDERSVLDLFQVYCSDYFQVIKDSSMSVLIPCVASKAYFDFVVSRFFVADQLSFPEGCWDRVSKVSYSKSIEEFKLQEQRNRYKLDELVNFFTLLTSRENAPEVIGRCDFSYSWWRPLFWMIASEQEKRFYEHPLIREYATPLYFPAVVRKLDQVYGFAPFASDTEMWAYVVQHPKIKSYHLDPLHDRTRAGA